MGMGDKEEINIIRVRVLAQNTNNKQLLSRQTAHCKRKDRDCIVSLSEFCWHSCRSAFSLRKAKGNTFNVIFFYLAHHNHRSKRSNLVIHEPDCDRSWPSAFLASLLCCIINITTVVRLSYRTLARYPI